MILNAERRRFPRTVAERWADHTGHPLADWDELPKQAQRLVRIAMDTGTYGVTTAQMDARAEQYNGGGVGR